MRITPISTSKYIQDPDNPYASIPNPDYKKPAVFGLQKIEPTALKLPSQSILTTDGKEKDGIKPIIKPVAEYKPPSVAWGTTKAFGPELAKVGKSIGQSIARSFIATSQFVKEYATTPYKDEGYKNLGEFIGKVGEKGYTPTGETEKKIFGTDKPISFKTVGEEVLMIGGEDFKQKWGAYSVPLGMVIGGLDITPFGMGKKDLLKHAVKGIAKTQDVPTIIKLVKPILKGSDEEIEFLAKSLKLVDKEEDIVKIFNIAGKEKAIKAAPKITKVEPPKITKSAKIVEEAIPEAEKVLINKVERNIDFYSKIGIGYKGDIQPLNPALRDLEKYAKESIIIKNTQKKIQQAITTGDIKINSDGTIKIYRGVGTKKEGFVSASYSKEIAQDFADQAGTKIIELTAKPKDIKIFIGGPEGEVLVHLEDVLPKKAIKPAKIVEEAMVTPAKIKAKLPEVKRPTTTKTRILAEQRIERQQQRFLTSLKDEITRELNKPKARQRSTIAFVKKLGEFNQTVANEIKKEIGLTKPLSKANLDDLNKVLTKMKERLAFKMKGGFKPQVVGKEAKPTEISEAMYKIAREMEPTKVGKIETIKKVSERIAKERDVFIQPISTRLKNIKPELKRKMREFEWNTKKIISKDMQVAENFLNKIKPEGKRVLPWKKRQAMTSGEYIEYDLALKNGDMKKINALNQKYNLTKEYDKIKGTLDDIYKRANDVGFDIGYKKDYFPRMIKDTDGFLEHFMKRDDWSQFDEAIKRKEMYLGRTLLTEEKASIINTLIRGYNGGQITLSGTGAMKHRIIDFVDPELNKFYMDSSETLVNYIRQVNDKIEARKFFGKTRLVDKTEDAFNNINDSIGSYVVDLLDKGKITVKQEKELTNILQARFNEKGTSGLVGVYKNLSYIGVMGSPFNTLTQIGDLGFAGYSGGLKGAVKETVVSAFSKSKIKKEDLFINRIATEFDSADGTARAVDTVFKAIGLDKVDAIGKEALVNSTISRMMNQAKKPTPKLMKELTEVFGKETDDILRDLQKGEITENVKYLAFNKLLDFQPVALSEVPEQYLKAGNGRIFYMLKTWSLKAIDVYRNEAFDLMAKGDRTSAQEGFINMLKLTGSLMAAELVADEAKDLLLGRERVSIQDRTIDNMLKLVMFSRYTIDRAAQQGIGSALALQIAPATAIIDNPYKDLAKLFKDSDESFKVNEARSIQNIPVGGKLYYWWFGKASTYKEKEKTTPTGLPKLPKLPGLPKLPKLPKL